MQNEARRAGRRLAALVVLAAGLGDGVPAAARAGVARRRGGRRRLGRGAGRLCRRCCSLLGPRDRRGAVAVVVAGLAVVVAPLGIQPPGMG